jgi:type I restriction enzyme S subunit
MIHDLKPYPAYKDSGVPWLGEVPEHWEVKRLKHVAKLNPSKSESMFTLASNVDVTFLPMKRVGVDGRINTNEVKPASALLNGFTYFRRDDVLVAKITPCFENGKGACLEELPTEIGFGSTEFIVLRSMPTVFSKFLYLITILSEFRTLGADAMNGAAGQQRVPSTFVGNFQTAIPPLPEQSAIVRYLDHIDRRIRRYIRTKQKLIKLLEEQKQAIIHQAVTRGLDPNVKLKPSGVEWLGDVPEHWKVKPAKWYYREVDERSSTGSEELLSVSHITGVTPRSEKNITMFMAESYVGYKLCRENDLVINTMWAWMAALGVARQTGIVSYSYGVYRPINKEAFLSQYIDLLLRIKPYVAEYICRSTGIHSSRLRLYPEQFLRIPIIRPPIVEQQAILNEIHNKTSEIEHAIHTSNQEISLLREYRTRLIADVVTGKLDVREAAANLPEELNETEVLDDELAEDEETTEENLENEPEE